MVCHSVYLIHENMTKQHDVLWIMLCQVVASFTAELVNVGVFVTFTAELVNVSSLFVIISCFEQNICVVAESIRVLIKIGKPTPSTPYYDSRHWV